MLFGWPEDFIRRNRRMCLGCSKHQALRVYQLAIGANEKVIDTIDCLVFWVLLLVFSCLRSVDVWKGWRLVREGVDTTGRAVGLF